MRVISAPRSYRRLIAAWLLALAAVSPAAAGSVEPLSSAAVSRPATRVAENAPARPALAARAETAAKPQQEKQRDPRLNDDLAAFSRAF